MERDTAKAAEDEGRGDGARDWGPWGCLLLVVVGLVASALAASCRAG